MRRPAIAVLIATLLSLPAFAQSNSTPSGPPPLDAHDVGAFFDGLVPYAIGKGDIAGLSLAVVKGDTILFQKGYGFADVAAGRAMTADTPMRLASITKTFTFTAVMQLVEQHRLDLDQDVNAYLDFHIPEAFGKPVTLRNLLTHTAGFEESSKHLFVRDLSRMATLRDYVRGNLPARIYPPGEIIAYSNYGAALAGYIVERVTGLPYPQYLEQHLFQPLAMGDSTALQPLPPRLGARLAKGYGRASTGPEPMNWVEPQPAGAITSTAQDLAHFAIAHLNDGRYGGSRILGTAAAQEMHHTSWRAAPGLNGYALGFEDESRNGLSIIGHGGDLQIFETDMHLLLDKKVGLIVLINSAGADGAAQTVRDQMFRAFVDRYFPAPPRQDPPTYRGRVDRAALAGTYVLSRRPERDFLSLNNLLSPLRVSFDDKGYLQFNLLRDLAGAVRHWRPVGPLEFRDGAARLVFVRDKDGGVRYLATDDFTTGFVFQPVPLLENGALVLPLLYGAALVLAAASLAWLRTLATGSEVLWRRVAGAAPLVDLLVMVFWYWLFAISTGPISTLGDHPEPFLTLAYSAGVVAVLLSLAAIGRCVLDLIAREGGTWDPLWQGAVMLSMAAFCWFVFAFHLASFRYSY